MATAEQSIEAKDVTIQTAVIEIKALTLNNKQMTLAVFRQLPRAMMRDMMDETAQLWGIVNYYMADEMIRQWVVFSARGKLFRAGRSEVIDKFAHEIPSLPQLFIAV